MDGSDTDAFQVRLKEMQEQLILVLCQLVCSQKSTRGLRVKLDGCNVNGLDCKGCDVSPGLFKFRNLKEVRQDFR